jgi:hypothetical protein
MVFEFAKSGLRFVLGFIVTVVVATNSVAADRLYLKKYEVFCDTSEKLCLYGSLTYRVNSRVISLNARVQKQTGPGEIYMILSGRNRQDDLRRTEIRIRIRGTHSEIVDHKMRPDAPDVSEWELASFTFKADESG